jgi:hypothetical protein
MRSLAGGGAGLAVDMVDMADADADALIAGDDGAAGEDCVVVT